jgi:hypothetical protein
MGAVPTITLQYTQSTRPVRDGFAMGTLGVTYSNKWVTASNDLRLDVQPIQISDGIRGNSPTDRVASPGSCVFVLDNENTVLGTYSPDHGSVATGWGEGTAIRLKATVSGTDYWLFTGWVRSIVPAAGKFRERTVTVRATDWFDEASRKKTKSLDLQENITTDQAVLYVMQQAETQTLDKSMSTDPDTLTYVFDNGRERTTALSEFQKLANSSMSFIFLDRLGTFGERLRYQSRYDRVLDTTVQLTLNNTMTALEVERTKDNTYDRVKVSGHPRDVGAAPEILATLNNTLYVGAGMSETFDLDYRDPNSQNVTVGGKNMIDPVVSTDYEFSSTVGGGGDLNANLTPSVIFWARAARCTVTNSGAAGGYVTKFNLRGTALRMYDPVTSIAEATNPSSDQELDFDLVYQDNPLKPKDFAGVLLAGWGSDTPHTTVGKVSFDGNRDATTLGKALGLQVGQRIAIVETVTGINAEFIINGRDITIGQGGQVMTSYTVVPAGTASYWILGTSELGVDTTLGF